MTNLSTINFRIAVIIRCYNKKLAISKVVADFRKELPEAVIYVFDNNSTDRTFEVANKAGARVAHVGAPLHTLCI